MGLAGGCGLVSREEFPAAETPAAHALALAQLLRITEGGLADTCLSNSSTQLPYHKANMGFHHHHEPQDAQAHEEVYYSGEVTEDHKKRSVPPHLLLLRGA